MSCTCFHSNINQACHSPHSSKVHQVHWWLDRGVCRSIHRHWQIPWQIQNLTLTWCAPHDTCPQEVPHHPAPEGQGTPKQDGMPGHDHPCRWTNRLGILHYLCSEGKWQAMLVLGSLWPQWGHLLRSSQDTHCGGSHSWVCALLLLHQAGCPPWILTNCPWPGLQPAYHIQQSLWKIPFPVASLWPHLFPRYLPEEDGSDPQRVPSMYWNCRQHHHPWPHWGRTWCPPVEPHVDCQQIWFYNPQKTHVKAQVVNFFGCLYDANGVHPDLGKVDAIHTLPVPTNVTKLQEFLGLVIYLSPFIPSLSILTTPLHELLKKDTDFLWNHTYDSTFQWVKEAVISDTTLRYFNPSLPMTLQVDASQIGLGAALLQNGKPVAFTSKALTETECWYANIERC